ncbi:MAG: hypothetical protein K0Q76_2642 [Panacagrimonas sp.]|jgi:hypothetical protein|nr:sulfotransferase family protein [Panacagrimonas sp.]MCC2657534.1 hypothetical protein [Panacagrimonas sp.]
MTLEVIGAGFGRTGTDSMREALNLIGRGPCHHMLEVNRNEEQKRLWRAFVQGAPIGWDALFDGFASCMDWPSAHYWKELADYYPRARVVLTWRSAESWWESFAQTLVPAMQNSTDPASLGLALVRDQVFGGRPQDRDHAIAVYEANVRAVKDTIAPERLLVHEAGEGWEPLCAFLGVPVPDQPYPSRNNADQFRTTAAGIGLLPR